ncbi:unnamed protein product [Allacma fusca]|uniref:S-adenosylmethionine decarboxylase proenzyme n=1 Tax=Allacma fusca TaxID=39272 RepID=A0A8J2J3R4_9HEXA|nr:unnamed protein product [Allacma fusca]
MESSEMYFEGVEKLLELWFMRSSPEIHDYGSLDLRRIPKAEIVNMLEIVKCEVISTMSNDYLDSYVLSESSLFISKKRVILKTCGTTTPLQCLKYLMLLVETYTGFDAVENVFYSRKNYKRPELQRSPHRNFKEELAILQAFFPDGHGYCLGGKNMQDCWYLYTYSNNNNNNMFENQMLQEKMNDDDNKENTNKLEPDQTCEVLMTELDPNIMKIFSKEVCADGKEATIKSGIDRIFPNVVINDHLFDPCGYSMNGIFKNGSYMTIHITPEPDYSYVSFETNAPQDSYMSIVEKVLKIFKPGKFIMTLFTNKFSTASGDQEKMRSVTRFSDEWMRVESKYCPLNNYDLTYAQYTKYPS